MSTEPTAGRCGPIARAVAAAALAASAAISGCAVMSDSTDYTSAHPGPVPDRASAEAQARDAIKGLMKDPESAQFRSFTPFFKMRYAYGSADTGEVLWTMCVEANAKNSFGGYADYEWFVVKFRDGQVVRDKNGLFMSEYPVYCLEGPRDPTRRAPG